MNTVLDLFSGCGGLSYGLELAGYRVVLGIDNWHDALVTFKNNHGDADILEVDLSQITPGVAKDFFGKKGPDMIVGGPPCQGFSIAGFRNPKDKRNFLYKSFVDFVDFYKPKVFLLENVPNLVSMDGGRIKQKIVSDFSKLGYKVTVRILLASDYGVPQNRRRAFFVGLINGKEFEFPQPTHGALGLLDKLTTKDALGDLPDESIADGLEYTCEPLNDYQSTMRAKTNKIYNHQLTTHTERTQEIIAMVPDGGNYKDLPQKLWKTRKVNIAWTRMKSWAPSFTIDTGHNHHFHYKYNRVPSVRESARLQSFPDDFIFYGGRTSQLKQVGNAVPPLLAKALGQSLRNFL